MMKMTYEKSKAPKITAIILLISFVLTGCAPKAVDYDRSPVMEDLDRENIPKPKEVKENQIWDIIDHLVFYEIGKMLDLGWTSRKIGNWLGIVGEKEAENINSIDDVPNSSWYQHRHAKNRMSIEELKRGPDTTVNPDTTASLEIIKGKFEGGSLGFTIKDASGAIWFLKFDGPGWYEMSSSAEVITTKILYAAGYNVPENHIFYFHPSMLSIGSKATVPTPDRHKRPMTMDDLTEMLADQPRVEGGYIRSIASKLIPGKPIGPFDFHSKRGDDPNDHVYHEHRRELRGLRVVSSWLGDTDRRAANTLDMYYTDENGKSYVKHYLIDMGSTLGSNWGRPHPPKYGYEYAVDFKFIAKSILSLGLYERPWADVDSMHYTSVGWYESEMFSPKGWVAVYPNAASENMTYRDAYWGSKILSSFTDEEVAAIVEEGLISDKEAEAYLIKTMIEKRNKIVKYWFGKVNPLDEFQIVENGGKTIFSFTDMAVKAGVEAESGNSYEMTISDPYSEIFVTKILKDETSLEIQPGGTNSGKKNYKVVIRTKRATDVKWGKSVEAHFRYDSVEDNYVLVAIRRDS